MSVAVEETAWPDKVGLNGVRFGVAEHRIAERCSAERWGAAFAECLADGAVAAIAADQVSRLKLGLVDRGGHAVGVLAEAAQLGALSNSKVANELFASASSAKVHHLPVYSRLA